MCYNNSIKEREKNMKNQKVFLKRKVQFLKEFLNIQLTKQNEYIKINDAKNIEENNVVIMRVLVDIAKLENQIYEINFNEHNGRLENDC
jgi:hypothetical protein